MLISLPDLSNNYSFKGCSAYKRAQQHHTNLLQIQESSGISSDKKKLESFAYARDARASAEQYSSRGELDDRAVWQF